MYDLDHREYRKAAAAFVGTWSKCNPLANARFSNRLNNLIITIGVGLLVTLCAWRAWNSSSGTATTPFSPASAPLQPSCPTVILVTPTGRLEAVVNGLDSVLYAVTLERAALNNASLNDDQKARFDAEIRRPRP